MIVVDTNVLIDVLSPDQHWREWSDRQLSRLNDGDDEMIINQVVLAELAANFPDLDTLISALDSIDIEVVPLPDEAAFAAGRAFRSYRRGNTDRTAILSDFLIGGHALHLGARLLTRDARLYRNYFPMLTLITPETHPHG